ncbi:MAG: SLBB domain-containing protein, partial [Spirochaetes bacterium]|nr:SLBB domain-containing protein [Spirochaetota bacterium]
GGENIPVSLETILFSYDAASDLALAPNDRVILPLKPTRVYVTGEVARSVWIPVSGKERLSEVLKDNLTAYSQTRAVVVKDAAGAGRAYDLFVATRKGDLAEDPVLKPGDRVEVPRAERLVSLLGEVRKPGKYALLPGDSLAELVSLYGDGALASSKTDAIVLTRKATAGKVLGESALYDLASGFVALDDGDEIRVPSLEEYLPIVYIEGASQADGAYGINRLPYRENLLLSQAVKPLSAKLPPKADLAKAYLLRGMEKTGVDLEKLLYAYDAKADIVLEPGDRIIIPFATAQVYVTGEVVKSAWMELAGSKRASEALKGNLTAYSQTRAVKVTSRDGIEHVYDLFLADRAGDTSQDPVLREGDRVEVPRTERLVTLTGEVRKPGKYGLLSGESLAELVRFYGDGVLSGAKTDAIVVTRKATAAKALGESVQYDLAGVGVPSLEDGDEVRVPSLEEYLPVVYIEGATQADGAYGIIRVPYRRNLLLSQAVKPLAAKLPPKADLAKAYLLRGMEKIGVDLEKLLYAYDVKADMVLKGEDRLVIPFGQTFAYVRGEVKKAGWVDVTATLRLSMAVHDNLTGLSSVRDIAVTGIDGSVRRYDLFSAERAGDMAQDPFLRPGDVIEVQRISMLVTISGEVRRPGTYQLLKDEGLKELIEKYADGFTERANPSRMSVVRYVSSKNQVGEKLQLDYSAGSVFTINLYDSITVPPYQDLLPVAWFEGAIGVGVQGSAPQAAQRIPYTFFPGETVSQAVQALRKSFSEVSDLSNAYISRKGEKISVNLSRFLYDRDDTGDQPLQPNDTIIVPFRQFFVTVSGAVVIPGRYPYVPDRTWEYYVGLAGGFDTERNSGQALIIYDVNSKAQARSRIIQPEDNIVAAANSFTYNFYKISSILTTILSVASLIISLLR